MIGTSLAARVALTAGGEAAALLQRHEADLPMLFIVSQVSARRGGPRRGQRVGVARRGDEVRALLARRCRSCRASRTSKGCATAASRRCRPAPRRAQGRPERSRGAADGRSRDPGRDRRPGRRRAARGPRPSGRRARTGAAGATARSRSPSARSSSLDQLTEVHGQGDDPALLEARRSSRTCSTSPTCRTRARRSAS